MIEYLQGDKVRLTRFTEGHVTPAYLRWLNDQRINHYLFVGRMPITKDEINIPSGQVNLRFAIMTNLTFVDNDVVKLNDYENYIGTISLHDIDWICRKGEVGYIIGEKEYWNGGFATQAVGLVSDYAFNRLNLNKITAGVSAPNIGSSRVLEKNGFTRFCVEPQDYFVDGQYFDTYRYYKLQNPTKEKTNE